MSKMSEKKVTIVLVPYEPGAVKPKKIKLGELTWAQKKDLISDMIPKSGIWDDTCSFNIHYDKLLTHVPANNKSVTFTPHHSKNKPSEIIIETIPDMERKECWANTNSKCTECVDSGCCSSPSLKMFIKQIQKCINQNQGI